jgi:hypothetical protein
MRELRRAASLAAVITVLSAGQAQADLEFVAGQRGAPQIAGDSVVWESGDTGRPYDSGAIVWSVPADGDAAPRALFSAPPVPGEGTVGPAPARTMPGQDPEGLAASAELLVLRRGIGVYRTTRAGVGSPNTYTGFLPTSADMFAGPPMGPLTPLRLAPDPADPCPAGTDTEIPLAASADVLVTGASCQGPGPRTERLLARTVNADGTTSPPRLLAGNGHSIGAIQVAGNYLAGIQSVAGSIQKTLIVLDLRDGDVVTTSGRSPAGAFYGGVDVASDGTIVATVTRGGERSSTTRLVRFARGSRRGRTLPAALGNVASSPQLAGSRIVFARHAGGGGVQIVSATRSGRQVRVLGDLDRLGDDLAGLAARGEWAAVLGTRGGRTGIWTARVQ